MNRPRYTSPPSLEYSKVPPNAVDLEEAVLGACLLEPVAINSVADILKAESFYKLEHQFIWESIAHLSGLSLPVDIMTVTQELKRQGRLETVGGAFYISKLTDRVGSSANAEYHARIVQQKFIARELIRVTGDLHARAYDETEDPLALLDEAGSAIADVGNGSLTEQPMSNTELVAECVKGMEMAQSSGNVIGIPTGLPDVDRVTGGFQEGHFDILAGRPGMGKSKYAIAEIYDISVKQGKPSVFYSLEMTAKELMTMLIALEANLDNGKVKKGFLSVGEWDRVHAAGAVLAKSPVTIVDNLTSWQSIRMDITRRVANKECSFVVIDYIQLMGMENWKGGNREQEVSTISRGIKRLAQTLKIPIRGIAQLSRSVETRGGAKRPMLSDLRECLSVNTSDIYTEKGVLSNSQSRINLLSLSGKTIKVMPSSNIPKLRNAVYRVKTVTGRFVDCTQEHPVLTSSGYKPMKILSKEDSLAVALKWTNRNGRHIKEARFIGWMIGNGCMYGYNVPSFITNDEVVANEFRQYIKERFGFFPKDHPHYQSKVFQYDCTNSPTGNRTAERNPVTSWLKDNDLWGRKAKDKHIPEWFMNEADNESVIQLIRGLWETDGSIAIGKRTTSQYSTTSIVLAKQLLYLLARIGIVANIDNGHMSKRATTPCYKLIIQSSDQLSVFKTLIPLSGKKGAKLNGVIIKSAPSHHLNKLNRDTTLLLSKIMSSLGKGTDRVQTHGNRRLTKKSLEKLIDKFPDELSSFSWVISENIFWDPIESIEYIGEVDVFDRSVPKTNNFVVNGIIVHNSGSLEQDANSVTFLYRPEYYGVEVSDETNLPTQGLCEVIIAKNRGGLTATVPVRADLSTGRFSEWDATPFTAPAPPAEVEVKWSPMPRSREFDDMDENPF